MMTIKTKEEINELNYTELDSYYWDLYFFITESLEHKLKREVRSTFEYVYNRLNS